MKKGLLLLGVSLYAFASFAQEQRVPLLEGFSASTCPPCRPGNVYLEGQMKDVDKEEYVKIKYQWYFPGTGDPYCTDESLQRTAKYGINGVPHLVIDGGFYKDHPQNGFSKAGTYADAKAVPAEYKLSGTYSINTETKEVVVNVNYTPLQTPKSPRLYVAVIENRTTKNVRTNGETEFFNIMKKMLPDHNGTDISATGLNTQGSTNLTFQFKGDYRLPGGSAGQFQNDMINHNIEHSVEDFSNLRVVAWVQGTDKVYQAANLKTGTTSVSEVSKTIKEVNIYPNPANENINISLKMENDDVVKALLVGIDGKLHIEKEMKITKGQNIISFDCANLSQGAYNVIIFDSNNNSFAKQVIIAK
jgi:thiol-disulfide isomerase/thioredoxin